MAKEKFYITTPIYYPSGNPHIGHCYTTVACDLMARYKRERGFDVMFVTGTDEHGLKIQQKAEEEGITPQEYVNKMAEKFQELWKVMNISYDRFVRTTDDYHVKTAQWVFEELHKKGYIYKGEYKGKYCVPDESFWTESQLIDGKCPECGREVIDASEEAYFFKLSEFAEPIKKLLTETDFLEPKSRVNQLVSSFIDAGLEDLCVSRTSFNWGIPVTFDDGHVIYVWIDALSNYISILGFHNDKYNDFEKYWPADMHMMAKEIVRFHAVIWPAILMALDLPLPKKEYSHGWITFGDQKMSKSVGNVVDPVILSERYGVDAVRYQILSEMPYSGDSAFSNELFLERINSDLANDYGNLVSRSTAMINKYFDGQLPEEREEGPEDKELLEMLAKLPEVVEEKYDTVHFSEALSEIFKMIGQTNKYIDATAPWALAKDDSKKARLASVLYNLLEVIRITSILLRPVMPNIAPEALKRVGADDKCSTWQSAHKVSSLPQNAKITVGAPLFPRIRISQELEELAKLA